MVGLISVCVVKNPFYRKVLELLQKPAPLYYVFYSEVSASPLRNSLDPCSNDMMEAEPCPQAGATSVQEDLGYQKRVWMTQGINLALFIFIQMPLGGKILSQPLIIKQS